MKTRVFSKLLLMLVLAASALTMVTVSFDAEARRFGGGLSIGRQSSNVMKQRQATKAPAAAQRGQSAAAAGARSGGSRWLGPLAGIAAGLGLAALLSQFGLSEAFGDLLVILLIAAFAIFILRRLAARSLGAQAASQGAQAGGGMHRQMTGQPFGGNQPGGAQGLFGSSGAQAASATPETAVGSWFIPTDFDQNAFLEEARNQFVQIQKAWDQADYEGLRGRLTNELYGEFATQLDERDEHKPTDVVMLNAELLGIEKLDQGYMASVRFSGMIREDDAPEATSFEEVWNLTKEGQQGWLLAGIQQT